ncbi:MAG: hypothetical protein L0154_16845 [Chloroflexi bacterium]|nr:hypothetical protein [Chloroflexota bacterium]
MKNNDVRTDVWLEQVVLDDGELPAEILAEFPVSQPEEPKMLRSQFTDTHHRSVSRRYPEHRSERIGSAPQSIRYGASYLESGVGTPLVDSSEPKVFAWICACVAMLIFVAIGASNAENSKNEAFSNVNEATRSYCVVQVKQGAVAVLYKGHSEESYKIGQLSQYESFTFKGSYNDGTTQWWRIDSPVLGEGWVKSSAAVLVGDGCY